MNKDTVEYFQNLNYDVIVKRQRGMFVVAIRELSLIAKDASLDNAYKKIEIEKEKYFREMIELGLGKSINEPEREESDSFGHNLRLFAAKCAVIFLLIVPTGTVGVRYVINKVNYLKSYKCVSRKIVRIAEKASQAIESMSEGERSALKLKLHKTIEQLKPFVDEFKILWQSPPTGKTGKLSKRMQ